MKAIVRNVLLAFFISTLAMFGALGGSSHKQVHPPTERVLFWSITERQKETYTCLTVATFAWVLCFWRCSVINQRLAREREFKARFDHYSRRNLPYSK